MDVIEVKGVSKSYKVKKSRTRVQALSDVSLSVRKGEIFGLIGPDGAGKTTLFRILTTLMLADSGTAEVEGMDVVSHYRELRRIIGYMPGQFSLYQDLSVEENLNFFATVFGTTVEENYDVIKDIYSQIEPFKKRRAGKLSGGMKQKLALSCALVHKPTVLFLDEPTTGVDAVSRKEFWNMLKRIRESGVTIFVSTPYMDEASLCDRVALIKDGRIIDTGSPAEIAGKFPYRLYAVKGEPMYPLLKYLRSSEGIASCFSFGAEHHVAVDGPSPSAAEILDAARANGFSGCSIREIEPGIEDCFMQFASSGRV